MNKEFIPYEESLSLKELGFDESSLAYWFNETPSNPEGQCLVYYEKPYHNNKIINGVIREYCWAPLYQQAFRWFRDKHKLLHEIRTYNEGSWLLTVYSIESMTEHGVYNGKRWELDNDENYEDPTSYEGAELICLKKLIEIVKNNK